MKQPPKDRVLDLQEDAAQSPKDKVKEPKPRKNSVRGYAIDLNKRMC